MTQLSLFGQNIVGSYRFPKFNSCDVLENTEVWETQCHKPTIWGWFLEPIKMVILGMIYC